MTDKPVKPVDLDAANMYAKLRGPDGTNTITADNITALHNLLSITGKKDDILIARLPFSEKNGWHVINF